MASMLSLSICLTDIDKNKISIGKNGKKYYELTLSISDEVNIYGQNVSAFDKQTKEEISNKEQKKYIGNGKVFWQSNTVRVANIPQSVENDLNF